MPIPARYGRQMALALTVCEQATCSTCRSLGVLLAQRGIEFESIEFHVAGLSEGELRAVLAKGSVGPHEWLRRREPLVEELGLDEPGRYTDDELIAVIAAHPRLLQRPVVVRGERAVLARPLERVLELLEKRPPGA
ncbi:MAG: arsenate reductase (glutaredoxin) [Solirubrobacteraceae bacterium]